LVLSTVPLSRAEYLATIAMITSRIEDRAIAGDVLLHDWKAAGLLHPSRARLAKVATVESSLLDRVLGRLAPQDVTAVKQALRRLLSFWT
jgi:mRNA-degrading endonuclease toxin of MazEF toxin-antitoxin module